MLEAPGGLKDDKQVFEALVSALQRAVGDKRYTDASRLVVELRRMVRRIHRGVEKAERGLQRALDERATLAQRSEARLGVAVVTSAGLSLLVSTFMLWLMSVTLRPMAALAAVVRRFAGGDRDARAETSGPREIRQLAEEYNRMADALEERERELVRHRDDLARAERLATLGHMGARVVHEIRNPLSSIGLNAELLSDELSDLGHQRGGDATPLNEAQELLTSIGEEVERLRDITEGYLKSASSTPQWESHVDVGALVRKQADFARAELLERGVILHLRTEAEVVTTADPRLLRQALWNLVRNAWEAMPDGGPMWLEVLHGGLPGDAEVVIAVEDDGPGLAQTDADQVFEAFFTTKPRGTGVGLAMVQQVAQSHGGCARVAAPRHGGGARVELVLPISLTRGGDRREPDSGLP